MLALLNLLARFVDAARVVLQVVLFAGLLIGIAFAAEAVHLIHNRIKRRRLAPSATGPQREYSQQEKKAA